MSYKRVGTATGTAETARADMLAAQREAEVFNLRTQGYDFTDIAQMCGYANHSGALKAYRRAISRIPRHTIEEMRANIFAQQMMAIKALMPHVMRGSPAACREMTMIHERMCKLFNLDTQPAPPDATLAAQVFIRAYPQAWAAALPAAPETVNADPPQTGQEVTA